MNPRYALEEIRDEDGVLVQVLVKYSASEIRTEFGDVRDIDFLFSSCVKKWGRDWDIPKVTELVLESELE